MGNVHVSAGRQLLRVQLSCNLFYLFLINTPYCLTFRIDCSFRKFPQFLSQRAAMSLDTLDWTPFIAHDPCSLNCMRQRSEEQTA